ncbi:MAG: hypothetical protein AAFV19_25320, partial [Pseudomonadota bacterium]
AAGSREDLKSAILRDRFPDLTVRNGLFAGLRYPGAAATGSALLPKLAGSYEIEIEPMLKIAADRGYSDIVDIGCAEGYYAVGLARLYPDAAIHAFDVDTGARRMCQAMAETNGVSDRVTMGSFCTPEWIQTAELGSRALIFSDCEGYEGELFTEATAPALARHDILIECHDNDRPGVSTQIKTAFEASHEITEVMNVPDYEKARVLELPELEGYNFATRQFIVEEARGAQQIWLFLRARAV